MRPHTRQQCFWEVACAMVLLRRTWRSMRRGCIRGSGGGVPHGGRMPGRGAKSMRTDMCTLTHWRQQWEAAHVKMLAA